MRGVVKTANGEKLNVENKNQAKKGECEVPPKKDLKGQKFGRLLVKEEAEPHILPSGKPRTMWLCICDCGNETIVSTQSLVQGTTVSCGCYGQEARLIARNKAIETALLGKKVGRWTVDSYAGQRILKSKQTRSQWNCTCECGTKRVLTTNQLTEGSLSCGCLRRELTSARETFDLTGRKINCLTVIERVGTITYGKEKLTKPLWRCICECGNECVVNSSALIAGKKQSCGCKRHLDLSGQTFGCLTVLDYCKERKKWLCQCICGETTYVSAGHLRSGNVISCGCKSMTKGEKAIYDYLKERNIRFEREYSFKKLKGPNGGLLRFDFAILDEYSVPIALIEYQGIQHYVEIENFGETEREITDFIKRLFCDQTHIPLYIVDFDDDITKKCDKIMSKIFSAQANAVPSL